MYDLIIIGNGAIGSFVAYNVLERSLDEKFKIAIVGPSDRKYGATVAAGAMHAVFAELEEFKNGSLEEQLFSLGLRSRKTFEHIFQLAPQIKTADKTIIYLKNNASEFELRNFQTVKHVASEYGVLLPFKQTSDADLIGMNASKHEDIIKLDKEYGFDSRELMRYLDSKINDSNIELIDARVTKCRQENNCLSFETNVGTLKAKKAINALGPLSNSILPPELQSIRQYQGVGTAFIVKKYMLPEGQRDHVIRTVNRGGAQCGIHVVPLNSGFYIGAGNYLAVPGEPELRLDTLRYLLDMASSEILPQKLAYEMTGSVIQGNRPRSLDGHPILGATSDSRLVFASAFNRVGLTCAPAISDLLVGWFLGKQDAFDGYLSWDPNRKPISYVGAKKEFVLSRVSNAIEHSLIVNTQDQIDLKAEELSKFYDLASDKIKKQMKFEKDFEIHPDMCGLLLKELDNAHQ